MKLHGKPVEASLSRPERVRRVADGFRFYAWLYRCLAVIFLSLVPVLWALKATDGGMATSYWAGASLMAGVYLWCVSGLGYVGAAAYGAGHVQGTSSLLAFMVMIVAFLSLFVAAASVVANHASRLGAGLNVVATGTLFVFGIGSYMIEILYLAAEQ